MPSRSLLLLALATTIGAHVAHTQESPRRFDGGGDLDKIEWVRPFREAQKLAKAANRVMLVKPILGGGNKPAPGGVACGGKNDCEGSW